MADYNWPARADNVLLGTEQDRTDGLTKSTGTAKYAYDAVVDKMLIARALGCPHAHCKIVSIDTSAAEQVPGVVSVHLLKQPENVIQWQGDLIAVVAAETEGAATEGVAALNVEYELRPAYVLDEYLSGAEAAGRAGEGGENTKLVKEAPEELEDDAELEAFADTEIERLLAESDVQVEGYYGIQAIAHMCLEPHGSTCVWDGDKLIVHLSTQNVSGTASQFAQPLEITADDVTVLCDFIGGGFGSKFAADVWGVACAQIARETGRGVKFMLTRDQELKIAGTRPSGFIKVRLGADSNGVIKVWDSHHWGSNGIDGGGISQGVIPYVFDPPNRRRRQSTVSINAAPARAWRAPNHPQACAITHTAIDDLAAKLQMDSYDVFMANLPLVSNEKQEVYAEQMKIAAKLMDWRAKWHPHGQGEADGSVVSGLGMALHTWGGGPHASNCTVKVHPDGGVETTLGTQEIGTGTRTIIGMIVAETFGLPLAAVKVHVGSSKYPESGPSGGSTTVGGVSESNRRAAQDAFRAIAALVAKKLKVQADTLVARAGRIHVAGDPDKGLAWKEACALLGMKALEVVGVFKPGMTETKLTSSQVAGVQMAEVAVDRATGIVRMKKYVAVQDMGLVINRKTARSQIHGAVVMGIAYALFEERIMDGRTGSFLNCEVEDYRLPRLGDCGEVVVEFYEPDSEYDRGVVGLGEPPVISPGAAISNAVANALGVRVPVLPLTPQRVLEALERAGQLTA